MTVVESPRFADLVAMARKAKAYSGRPPLEFDLLPHQQEMFEAAAQFRVLQAGRFSGKTWGGGAFSADRAENLFPGLNGIVIAPTDQMLYSTLVNGPGGIRDQLGDRWVDINQKRGEITTVAGSKIYLRSASSPDRIRGLNAAWVWWDEYAQCPGALKTWQTIVKYTLRQVGRPEAILTSTPEPNKFTKWVARQCETDQQWHRVHATSFDNTRAPEGLLDTWADDVNTTIGRQELLAEILEEAEGALWTRDLIRYHSIDALYSDRPVEIVLSVDPTGGDEKIDEDQRRTVDGSGRDDVGIIAVAKTAVGDAWVVGDWTTNAGPLKQAKAICRAYFDLERSWGRWNPTITLLMEANGPGAVMKTLVEKAAIHDFGRRGVSPFLVTASKSKRDRALPVVTEYERRRVFHLDTGEDRALEALEDEMLTWVPDKSRWSPNRIDALVHGIQHLFPHGIGFTVDADDLSRFGEGYGR